MKDSVQPLTALTKALDSTANSQAKTRAGTPVRDGRDPSANALTKDVFGTR